MLGRGWRGGRRRRGRQGGGSKGGGGRGEGEFVDMLWGGRGPVSVFVDTVLIWMLLGCRIYPGTIEPWTKGLVLRCNLSVGLVSDTSAWLADDSHRWDGICRFEELQRVYRF